MKKLTISARLKTEMGDYATTIIMENDGTYVAYLNDIPEVVVECKNMNDIQTELSEALYLINCEKIRGLINESLKCVN